MYFAMAILTTARTAPFIPGESPPLVITPIRRDFGAAEEPLFTEAMVGILLSLSLIGGGDLATDCWV
jgi:hypothetical protein